MINRLLVTAGATAICWTFGSAPWAHLQEPTPYTLIGMWKAQLVLVAVTWVFLLRLIWSKS